MKRMHAHPMREDRTIGDDLELVGLSIIAIGIIAFACIVIPLM